MGRKVFISFLGASNYGLCDYRKNGESYGGPLRFIQEATLSYLQSIETWTDDDAAYILLTDISESKNWLDDGQRTKDGEVIRQSGLKSRLDDMRLPFPVTPIRNLPDGNDEKEIWEIFSRIFDVIQDDDALFLDITHGYRYLPMLMLVLCNYSKFLKRVSVRSITYGNYEISERGNKPGLIVDLLPLSALQDWTYAAGQYLDSGNVNRLEQLCIESVKPILKETKGKDEGAFKLRKFVKSLRNVIDERQSCRGLSIIKSDSFSALKNVSDNMFDTMISPLNPVLAKIRESFEPFDSNENVKNGFSAAKWCFENGLIQQATTILQEAVVSYCCPKFGISIDDDKRRESVNSAFLIQFQGLPEEKWIVKEDRKAILRRMLREPLFNDRRIVDLYHNLDEVRNDLNHSGMRSTKEPLTPESIRRNIQKCLDELPALLCVYSSEPLLINLTNHPSHAWSHSQKEAAEREYGEVIDLPFPSVSPGCDESAITELADEYMEKVRVLAEGRQAAVHIMGEMTFTLAMVRRLQTEGISCVASTTERVVTELPDGRKESCFKFVCFRQYESL